jgi:hypothetical protein
MSAKTNRRWLITLVCLALAIGIGTISSQSILQAQGAPADSLQGTWLASVTLPDGSNFLSLQTFMRGGDVLEENSSPRILSLGHGAWVKTGDRQFTVEFVKFRFDAPATRIFTGTSRITFKIQLDTPDSFHTTSTVQGFDAAGNPAGAPRTDIVTAKRLYATGSQP